MGRLKDRPSAAGVELVEQLDPLREEWTRLAAVARNVFSTWEWHELWWRHYGGGRSLRVGVSRDDDGEVEAIVPLFVWSQRPLRILRLLGHGHGDRLGPICREEDAQTAQRSLQLALEARPHDLFIGDWVPGEREWVQTLGGRVVRRTGYPILRYGEDTWDKFYGGLSHRFRKTARNSVNRLRRDHAVRYRFADAETLEDDLDSAFRLHRARFGVHVGCSFCGDHEPFQREFARIAHQRGWLRLLLLELDGQPVSCEYGFVFQDAYFAYQGGRDPAWDRYSVGFVLELESVRRTLDEGVGEYRFLGGAETYKYRFPTEDPGLETVVAPASRRGRAAAVALEAAWRFPAGKTLLRRIGSART